MSISDRRFLTIRSKQLSVGSARSAIKQFLLHFLEIAKLRRSNLALEGLCSPRDLAHTPPGIITKVGVLHLKKPTWKMTGVRLVCLCCSKKNHCYCKKCTLEKLKLYSRKENISMRAIRKGELEKEIDEVFGEMSSLHAEINTTTANITLLRKWVSDKRQINKVKTDQVNALKQLIASTSRHTEKVLAYYNKHESNESYMQKRKAYKEAKVEEMNEKLSMIRKALCGSLFSIFPVSEVVAHAVDLGREAKRRTSNTAAKWTVVSGHQIEEGPMIKLVNCVAVVFDFRLPYLLSHREISLRERWSQELLDNDWFKFCQSVLSLGLHLGMSPESLHFNYPHSNIIEEARFVIESGAIPKPHPLIIGSNHRFEITKSLSQVNIDERELVSL
ncbi:hypothetical protein KIN20_006883 [Parelaphostrongylus tenuis]|uniref:Uncharacterized protein n=1 Tax=Parelaphostrongylus tenuis TaxID=148309 RepID=A0AAD5QH99_PARTN|nr:hypothetical protein KIN20_006883 [Parelaphostrongylus tenuis]